ncbi:MAG: hypothetical protein NVSMB24_40180 [Mucilaginibacter sp.]
MTQSSIVIFIDLFSTHGGSFKQNTQSVRYNSAYSRNIFKMNSKIFTVISILLCLAFHSSRAQISVRVNINAPPAWAPPAEAHVIRYYYIPEEDSYYDAVKSGYYYNDDGRWVFSNTLPALYNGYDIAKLHHVPFRYYGNEPYNYFNDQRYVYLKKFHNDWRPYGYNRPQNLPPGLAKKQGYWIPPGQAKKLYKHHAREGHDEGDKNDE